jgi:hypothetical protein
MGNIVRKGIAANELFLFSILTNRWEMAKIFWRKGAVSVLTNIFIQLIF